MRQEHLVMGAILGLVPALAFAADKKLLREQVPAHVLATADRETQGVTVKGYLTEREGGRQVYEVETIVNGHTRDLQIAEDGTLNEIEEEVAFSALPSSVQAGLKTKAKGAEVVKVESLIKKGKLVAYEADTLKGRHKGSIQVGPSGGPLTHEE